MVKTYKERLAIAMGATDDSEPSTTAQVKLAEHLGVSRQAIKKIFRGETAALSAENNSKAAKFLGVDPDWLATGEGPQPSGPPISPAGQYLGRTFDSIAVDPEDRETLMTAVEAYMRGWVAGPRRAAVEPPQPAPEPTGRPFRHR